MDNDNNKDIPIIGQQRNVPKCPFCGKLFGFIQGCGNTTRPVPECNCMRPVHIGDLKRFCDAMDSKLVKEKFLLDVFIDFLEGCGTSERGNI